MEKVYVFNPSLGGEDTAERKVLFFHPASTPVSEQVNSVGLCEALTNFTRTFGPTSSSSEPLTLHTQQRRHVFFEAEAGIWFAVVSRNAALPKSASRGSSATTAEPAGAAPAEPSEEELQDSTLHALLRRVYEGVQLACGQLSLIASERGWEGLRRLLATVMRPYLQIMLSQGEDETARLDVLDTFDGMCFLPIDSLLYLKVQMALNQLLTNQPNVVHTALFFEGQLVYSSLSRGGTQQLHRLVTKMMGGPATKKPEPLPDLSRAADEEHLFALVHALRHSAKPSALPAGRFVCGAGDLLQDDRSAVRVPLVHVEVRRREGGEREPGPPENRPGEPSMHLEKGEADLEAFRLVVFELQQSVVVMLLDDKPPLWSRPLWFQEVASLVVEELQPVAALLAEQHSRLQAIDEPYRYVYLNQMNLAVKAAPPPKSRQQDTIGKLALSHTIKVIMNRTRSDFLEGHVREVVLKLPSSSEGWFVGRISNGRELYMLTDSKVASMSEVHQELQALRARNFFNIFTTSFLD